MVRRNFCTVCDDPTVLTDALTLTWCATHKNRGDLLTWGYRHGFPHIPPFNIGTDENPVYRAIAPLKDHWVATVTMGTDDLIETALKAIAYEENNVA
jgi:hypothetical protein